MFKSIVGGSLFLFASLPAFAQVPCYAEHNTPHFAGAVSMDGALTAIRFTPSSSFDATRLEVYTGSTSELNTLALWSHDASVNEPEISLGEAAWIPTLVDKWQGVDLPAPVPLAAGTVYWLVWQPGVDAQASVDNPGMNPGQVYRTSTDGGLTWSGPFQDNIHRWKFRIYGTCATAPTTYCTAGVSSQGCVASISVNDNPHVSNLTPCDITVSNVEGVQLGIVFYGLSSQIQRWCSLGTSSSYLCVKSPHARTNMHATGGTAGRCDGTLSLDWSSFQLMHPNGLGAPWTAGEKVFVQTWIRDAAACRGGTLSNALELTYLP